MASWTQSQPTPSNIYQFSDFTWSQRIDPDVSTQAAETTYVMELQAAAVEYAEDAMACSLLNRTITATYNTCDLLYLPRGPIQSITSVTDANGPITGWTLQGVGNSTLLVLPTSSGYGTGGFTAPLTVVYTAGYGTTASSIPANIRIAVRNHVGTLYENRESVSDKAMVPVPHSLDAFYALKRRSIGMG